MSLALGLNTRSIQFAACPSLTKAFFCWEAFQKPNLSVGHFSLALKANIEVKLPRKFLKRCFHEGFA
jgi:hypothetical protein